MSTIETVCRWNSCFREVNEFRGRYRILKGSAGSGKSTDIAQDYVKKLSDERYRGANLLVVRKVDETNRDSTFAELQSRCSGCSGSTTTRSGIYAAHRSQWSAGSPEAALFFAA